ncbi:MAG: hypothetical protein ACKVY0_04985 [Prosthecobacter sp.]|uniref:hypothetical protein n=1 Tax=Prosthecobacter sp. TaxID=1965333 RepID=UPI003903EFB5
MKPTLSLLPALLLTPLVALHAAETSPIQISDHTVIFKHTSTDPKDPANTSGFNSTLLNIVIAILPRSAS